MIEEVNLNYSTYRKFGFNILTGEACNIGMRVLIDLTGDGKRVWDMFTNSEATSPPWNQNGKASIMIPRSWLKDLMIAHLFLLKNCHSVLVGKSYLVGFSGNDQPHEPNKEEYIIRKTSHPSVGLNNVHQMSGRVK